MKSVGTPTPSNHFNTHNHLNWPRTLTVMGTAALFVLTFWLIDGLMTYYLFSKSLHGMAHTPPETLGQALSFNVMPYTHFMRLLFVLGSLVGGILVTCYLHWQCNTAQTLWETEAQYRTLFNSTPVGIGMTTINGHILEANEALLEMGGYAWDDIRTTNITTVYPDATVREKMLTELQAKGKVHNFEARFKRKDGSLFDANLTITPVSLGGETVLMTVAQDVTDKVQTKEALIAERAMLARRVEERTTELLAANIALVEASRLKDEFLANMNHELRTPLTVILTLTGMLQQQLYGPLQERQQQALNNIAESGQRLLNLITDVWDLSKLEAGHLELQHTPFQVASVCDASLEYIHQHAQRKQITVIADVAPDIETMTGDQKRIQQILTNLLDNAVKFTPESGEVGLEVRGDTDRNLIQFVVWDTGIGIAPEKIGRLFQPFTQVDGSSTREYEGSGLGLALVDRLARMHEGMVTVQSEESKGSRFTVVLPWNIT